MLRLRLLITNVQPECVNLLFYYYYSGLPIHVKTFSTKVRCSDLYNNNRRTNRVWSAWCADVPDFIPSCTFISWKISTFFIAIRCILLLLTLGSSWLLFSSACRFWKSKYIADKLLMKLYNFVQAAKRNKGLFHVQILGIYQMNDHFFLDFQPFIEAFHKQRKYKCIVGNLQL